MKKSLLLFALLFAQVFTYKLLGKSNFFIQKIYYHFYAFYSQTLSAITNYIPFSVGDVIYFFIGLGLLILVVKLSQNLLKRKLITAQKNVHTLLKSLNVFILIFYLVWGFVYYFPDLEDVYDIENIETQELKTLSENYLNDCKKLRQIVQADTNVYVLKSDHNTLTQLLQKTYIKFPSELKRLEKAQQTSIKKSLYSPILVYFGISGYFNPFTQECQYNYLTSDYKKNFTIAHEISHKWAYGKENQASFSAFLLAEYSQNPELEYSSKMMALRYLLGNIYANDSLFVKQKLSEFSAGMKADRKADSLLHIQYQSPLRKGFYGLNNAFLQFNEQDGISSYNRYTNLVVGFERAKKKK